jgi:hypothetical protein
MISVDLNGPSGIFQKYSSIGDLVFGFGAYYSKGEYVSTLCLGGSCLAIAGVLFFLVLPSMVFDGFLVRWSFAKVRSTETKST